MTIITRRQSRLPGELVNLRRLNTLLDETLGGWPFAESGGTVTSAWYPSVDVFEGQDALKLVAELPGVKPEDVKLSLENHTLTLRGEKKQAAEEKTERMHRYERTYGGFERTFSLPNTVGADRVEANFQHGVLTVTLPKVQRARPREIPVAVK